MSDRFEGTALLIPYEDIEHLHVLAVHADGSKRPHRMWVPVQPAETPKKEGRTTWEYTIAGDTIHVSPSVKTTDHEGKELFHSAGQWAVKFERFTPSAEVQWKDGIGDHGERARFIELNPGDFSV